MTDKINGGSNEKNNAYIKAYMAKLPEYEKGETHIVKNRENLWEIAKKQVGKQSKRKVINDYVYAIAKVNGFDTEQKMNNLKIDDVIYLPKDPAGSNVKQSSKGNTVTATSTAASNNAQSKTASKSNVIRNKKVTEAQTASVNAAKTAKTENNSNVNKTNTTQNSKSSSVKNDAEVSFGNRLNAISTSKNIKFEPPNPTDRIKGIKYRGELYYVYDEESKKAMSFLYDKKHRKIIEAKYSDDNYSRTIHYGFDYVISEDNTIRINDHNATTVGKITKEQRAAMERFMLQHVE